MKILISKDILPLAKLAKSKHRERPVHIFPDGRIMATDGFSLIEVNREAKPDEWTDAPVQENEWMEVENPILLSPKQIVEKQRFEKKVEIPILEKGYLLKDDDGKVIVRTTDLETTTDVHYIPSKDTPIDYESIFPDDPKQNDTYSVDVIASLLARVKELGITQVTFMKQEGERQPLILFAKDIRALVMPTNDNDDRVNSYKEKKHGRKKA